MNRREFVTAAAGAALLGWRSWAAELPGDVRITRIVSFDLQTRRPKYIGRNSRRDDHGITSADRMMRLFTNAGVEGLATGRATREQAAAMLGRSIADFFRRDERRMVGPFERSTAPLWDLAGKVLKKPVYRLLGGDDTAPVPVYDGSIYLADLLEDHKADWQNQFRREIEMGLQSGHRGFKIKVGRGAKWMPPEEGYARDLEVVRLIRQHAGRDVLLGVDANQGYDFDRTRRFVADLADCRLAFIEQMFPTDVEKYLALKEFLRRHGPSVLIADGESSRRPEDFQEWVDAGAVDILQGDMNQFGFEDVLRYGAMGRPKGIRVAPHNWGSLVGFYLQLHVARAMPNFYRAEHDPLASPALFADGYRIRDGVCTVPEVPGLGLSLEESKLEQFTKVHFDLKA